MSGISLSIHPLLRNSPIVKQPVPASPTPLGGLAEAASECSADEDVNDELHVCAMPSSGPKPELATSDALLICKACGTQYDVRDGEGKDDCRICDVCLSDYYVPICFPFVDIPLCILSTRGLGVLCISLRVHVDAISLFVLLKACSGLGGLNCLPFFGCHH